MKSIKTRNVIGEVIGIILALIILSPFILVVLNSAKNKCRYCNQSSFYS